MKTLQKIGARLEHMNESYEQAVQRQHETSPSLRAVGVTFLAGVVAIAGFEILVNPDDILLRDNGGSAVETKQP